MLTPCDVLPFPMSVDIFGCCGHFMANALVLFKRKILRDIDTLLLFVILCKSLKTHFLLLMLCKRETKNESQELRRRGMQGNKETGMSE